MGRRYRKINLSLNIIKLSLYYNAFSVSYLKRSYGFILIQYLSLHHNNSVHYYTKPVFDSTVCIIIFGSIKQKGSGGVFRTLPIKHLW